jgi:hypothetical protein
MMYWVTGNASTSRACTHIGSHNYHVARGDCRESRVLQDQLLQEAVGRSPTSSLSSIAMSASLGFLGDQLIGKYGKKPLLISDTEMQEVMYKFESITSPTLRQNVCKFKRMGRSGVIDGVYKLRGTTRWPFVQDNRFSGQGKKEDKVFVLKEKA